MPDAGSSADRTQDNAGRPLEAVPVHYFSLVLIHDSVKITSPTLHTESTAALRCVPGFGRKRQAIYQVNESIPN